VKPLGERLVGHLRRGLLVQFATAYAQASYKLDWSIFAILDIDTTILSP
jgi:hypothetical protein